MSEVRFSFEAEDDEPGDVIEVELTREQIGKALAHVIPDAEHSNILIDDEGIFTRTDDLRPDPRNERTEER